MITLPIEHLVTGSPLNERGDGALSSTLGISSYADQVSKWLDIELPNDHAVFMMLVNPETNLNTFVHAQGCHTIFADFNRAYNTRAIYELTREAHGSAGLNHRFIPVVAALDKMKQYQERVYGQPNQVAVDVTRGLEPLTFVEEILYNVLVHAVVNNRQVFIRLGDGDKRFGDELRESPKLHSLLRAIDNLPDGVRGYVSMGFSLEAGLKVSQIFADHLLIIAHHDNLAAWGDVAHKDLTIDWQGDELNLVNAPVATPAEHQRMVQVAPLINAFLGNGRATRNAVMGMMQLIPENVDRLLSDGANPIENDIKILMALYESSSPNAYRQTEAVSQLLRWKQSGIVVPISLPEVLKRFPKLEQEVKRVLVDRVDKAINYQQLVVIYRDNANVSGLLDTIKQKVLSSRKLMDEAASMPLEPLSALLQGEISTRAKKFSLAEKLDRLNNAYYALSVNDLEVKGWGDYIEVINYLKSHGNTEFMEQLAPDVKVWKVDDIDASVYNELMNVLSVEDQKELNARLNQQVDKLPADLARSLASHMTIEDREKLMKLNDSGFVKMMDLLLENRSSFIHSPEAAPLRHRYVEIQVRKIPFSDINTAVWGTDYADSAVWLENLVLKINYNSCGVNRLINDVNFVCNHLIPLPENVKSHFEKAISSHCQGRGKTLLDVARLLNKVNASLQPRVDTDAIMSSGAIKELLVEIEELEKNGHQDLAQQLNDRYQALLQSNAVSTYGDVITQLRKHPYPSNTFAAHTPDSLFEVLEKKALSLADYFTLVNLVTSSHNVDAIKRAGHEDLFDEAIDHLEKAHAAEWLLDEQNTSTIIKTLKENSSNRHAALLELIDALSVEDREQFKLRYSEYFKESAIQTWKDKLMKLPIRRIGAAIAAMVVVGGMIISLLLHKGIIGPSTNLSDGIVSEPLPAWMIVRSTAINDSVYHIDSCRVTDRHLMSMLAQWYQDAFITGTDRFNVEWEILSEGVSKSTDMPATAPMTNVSMLWHIDSVYYLKYPVQQSDSAFLNAMIVTESNETINVSRITPLLKISNERQLAQQVREVQIDSLSFTIPNQVFLEKNRNRRDLAWSVYMFWLINQIDDSCKQQTITKLFPY